MIGVIVVSTIAVASICLLAIAGWWLMQRSVEDVRAQMHASIVDERASFIEERRASADERKMLLDRLSDREGAVAAIYRPPMLQPERSSPPVRTVPWDDDLAPLPGEELVTDE